MSNARTGKLPDVKTIFGSVDDFDRGGVQVIDDDAKNYVFSNVFDVARHSMPFERVAVAKNFEYVIEAMRADGESEWFAARHDEFALCMDGEVRIDLLKPTVEFDAAHDGAAAIGHSSAGTPMGYVKLRRGHQALLPAGAHYRFSAPHASTVLIQTIDGPLTQHRWEDICQQT